MHIPGFHCELEHVDVAFIYVVFLTFLVRGMFKAINWIFLLSSKVYFMHHSTGAILGTGESWVSAAKMWIMN